MMLAVKCLIVYALLPIIAFKFGLSLKNIWHYPMEYLYFGVSVPVTYFLMYRYGGSRLRFAQTFTHELVHSIFVWLSIGRVYEFHVNEETGHIMSDREYMTMVLAPYFFPLYTLLLMAVRPGILPDYYPLFDVVCGASFAFYLNMIKQQSGLWQTDIRSVDWRLSYPYMVCMVFFCCYLVLESIHSTLWSSVIQLLQFIWKVICLVF